MRVTVRDAARTAQFTVEAFVLRGIDLSATLPDEAAVIASLLETPIDPELLLKAATVSDALATIAINASNVCCAQLSRVYSAAAGRSPPHLASTTLVSITRPVTSSGGALPAVAFACGPVSFGRPVADEPLSMETLPSALLMRIVCTTGCLRSTQALADASRALRKALSEGDEGDEGDEGGCGACALPLHSDVVCESPRSVLCEPHALGALLTRTSRPGHGLVHVGSGSLLRTRSALLELTLLELDAIGGIQLGVCAVATNSDLSYGTSAQLHDQLWFDGCGRLAVGSSLRRPGAPEPPRLYGERQRRGDRVGILFDAPTCSVALVTRRAAADEAHDALNSLSLLGPLVPLRHPGGAEGGGGLLSGGGRLVGYEFCLRFDWQAGLVARIDATRRTPVDVRALTRRACAAPRPLAPHEPPIIVRTLGPDAQNVGVHLDPASATVAELRGELAKALGCEADHQVEVRAVQAGLRGAASSLLLASEEDTLAECGVDADPSGSGVHSAVLQCHIPHLIS